LRYSATSSTVWQLLGVVWALMAKVSLGDLDGALVSRHCRRMSAVPMPSWSLDHAARLGPGDGWYIARPGQKPKTISPDSPGWPQNAQVAFVETDVERKIWNSRKPY
jgi:hypothetical protein